jgi:hypothetical protein
MKSGLYICKCYWMDVRTKEISPVLKFGMTTNIDTRMYHYNKRGSKYKLLAFFPCSKRYLKEREDYFKEYSYFSDWCRISRSEHIEYEKGYFKKMFSDLKDAADIKIRLESIKNQNGQFVKWLTFGGE